MGKVNVPSNNSPYWMVGRSDIERQVSVLCAKANQIVLQDINNDGCFILTTIVEIKNGLMTLEASSNEKVNNGILNSSGLWAETTFEKIPIMFEIMGIRLSVKNGRNYFVVKVPNKIHKLQRREFFRLHLPLQMHSICILKISGEEKEFKICDMSIGGLCIAVPSEMNFEQGERIDEGYVLIDNEKVIFTSEVRYKIELQKEKKMGLKFINLSSKADHLLGRFIMLMQRELHHED